MMLTSTSAISTALIGILLYSAGHVNAQGAGNDGGSNSTGTAASADPIPTCTTPPNPCADSAHAVTFFRSYHAKRSDHFYTTFGPEHKYAITNLGYTAEGSVGRIWTTQQTGTVPLYRLYAGDVVDHFYTISAIERENAVVKHKYTYEGVAGYVYPNPTCGAIPLYRTYSYKGSDHFYTQDAAERLSAVKNLGFLDEGIEGYILP